MTALDSVGEDELFACVEEYRRATGALRAAERAVRLGHADADEHLAAAEAVITARLAFVRCLVAAGWTPPADAVAAAARDGAIAEEANGAVGG